ncbi:AP2 [Babesia gibsoni]|uniref:AP2 n=1 Tax=Babesia gibsoni TaxID=33632 RepID=A0AAD8PF03_BABGI|nr:AP2 [Babesia gibsoni]
MFQANNYSGSVLGERWNSINGTKMQGIAMDQNPTGHVKDLRTESFEDLISCIKTWQKSPTPSGINAISNRTERSTTNEVNIKVGSNETDSSRMHIPVSEKHGGYLKRRMYSNDDLDSVQRDFGTVGSPLPYGALITTPIVLDTDTGVNSENEQLGKDSLSFEDFGSLDSHNLSTINEGFLNEGRISFRVKRKGEALTAEEEAAEDPRLFYLTSSENMEDERLSESEENPLLTVGMDRIEKAVITPRDILSYGRNWSFQEVEGPFIKNTHSKASEILKDVSINCQIETIRSVAPRQRRPIKDKSERNANIEEYAQMAADLERIRGVCYCRSDNSWTAWWTEKGRNRKKAFKVSRFGFDEARSMAIAHRMSIEEKIPELRTKHAHKDSDSDMSVDRETPATKTVNTPDDYSSSGTPTSTPSPSMKPVTRMQTRGIRVSLPEELLKEHSSFGVRASSSPAKAEGKDYMGIETMAPISIGESYRSGDKFNLSYLSRGGEEVNSVDNMRENISIESTRTAVSSNDAPPTPLGGLTLGDSGTSRSSKPFSSSSVTPRDRVTLNREMIDYLTLDPESARSMEIAMSTLAFGLGWSVLPTGETVRILPNIATDPDGSKVTAVIIRHN